MAAFLFDRACILFGTEVEAAMDARTDQKKSDRMNTAARQRVLDRYLQLETSSPGRFRDPAKGVG